MNPILLQKQLKENSNDLQDFYKDLQSWGDEMKRKENSLKTKEDSLKKTKIQPKDKTEKITELPKALSKTKMSKVGSTDYAKWEKFDADLECEQLEDDIKDDSELTDEFEDSYKDEALVHKEKGNSYVKAKEWNKAIESYTKAIKCYSYDPIFYANRALCHLKKQNFVVAEEDCTLSLKLDSTYVKALQRRAAAREALGKLDLAKSDLEMVLTHEPKNKESLASLKKIKEKIGPEENKGEDQRPVSKFTASRNKLQSSKPTIFSTTLKTEITQKPVPKIDTSGPSSSSWPDPSCEIIPVRAIDKPPHLRSKKPLKRIEITEIDSFLKATESKKIVEEIAVKKHVVEKIKTVTFEENDNNATEPIEVTSAFKKKRDQTATEMKESPSTAAWPKSNLQSDHIKCEDLKIFEKIENTLVQNNQKDVKNSENLIITEMNNKIVKDVESEKPTVGDISNDFLVPKTSVQFYNAWKNLKTQSDKYKYLKLIDPNDFPNLFQESLESNVFSSILDVLSTQFIDNGENIYPFLRCLTLVKRFSALTMFMDSTDKNRMWKLITYLREHKKTPKEDVDNLVLKYEL